MAIDISKYTDPNNPRYNQPFEEGGQDVSVDPDTGNVVVRDGSGISVYDPTGKLVYGKGARQTFSVGDSTTGTNLQDIGGQNPSSNSNIGTPNSTAAPRTPAQIAAEATAAANAAAGQAQRQSAYDLLYAQFKENGLESLVEPLKGLIVSGASPAEFTIKLRDTDAYKKRFAANAKRVANGLAAIDEAAYIKLEDQYQRTMMQYGLPESYYARGDLGRQQGFEELIANDVSNLELEDRISTAQKRVIKQNVKLIKI